MTLKFLAKAPNLRKKRQLNKPHAPTKRRKVTNSTHQRVHREIIPFQHLQTTNNVIWGLGLNPVNLRSSAHGAL